jgi:hypothetical protein
LTRSALEAIVKWLVMVLDLPVRLVDMLLARSAIWTVVSKTHLRPQSGSAWPFWCSRAGIVDPMAPGTTTAMRFSPVVLN